jgi:hypothetical protein
METPPPTREQLERDVARLEGGWIVYQREGERERRKMKQKV